jgi:hypothetical protein
MKRHIWSDRHNATALADRQKGGRRNQERRKSFRLVYPPFEEPRVLNANFLITDISQNGIRFVCNENCKDCTNPISLKSTVAFKIQFHDGETIDVKIKILRCERTLHSREKTYSGYIENSLSNERIAKEQAYLLNHFPDFCRFSKEWIL